MMEDRSLIQHVNRYIQKNRRVFRSAERMLSVLHQAREGGRLSRLLALCSAVGQVADIITPESSPWTELEARGLQRLECSIGAWMCALLRARLPYEIVAEDSGVIAVVWNTARGRFGAIFHASGASGPYIDSSRLPSDGLYPLLRELLWMGGRELQVMLRSEERRASMDRFTVCALGPLGARFSETAPDRFVHRLQAYGPGPRTVVLLGPTGAGKGVLARRVSQQHRPEGRTLKLDAHTLRKVDLDELLDIVRVFAPTVLLLDDLNLRAHGDTERFLATLEALRSPSTLTLVTMMTTDGDGESQEDGAWHFAGMRPGRVDDIWWVGLPESEERRCILAGYIARFGLTDVPLETLVSETDGLSAAFLKNLVERLAAHGVSQWHAELRQVRKMAPPYKRKESTQHVPNGGPAVPTPSTTPTTL